MSSYSGCCCCPSAVADGLSKILYKKIWGKRDKECIHIYPHTTTPVSSLFCRFAQQDPHTTIYTCVLITVGAVAGAVADALQNITPDELFGDQGQRGYTEGVTEEEERVGHAADKFAAAERLKGGAKLEEGGMPTWPSTHEEGQVRGAQGPEEASPKPR